MDKVKIGVSHDLTDFINKMLKKEQTERPTIEEIIFTDSF